MGLFEQILEMPPAILLGSIVLFVVIVVGGFMLIARQWSSDHQDASHKEPKPDVTKSSEQAPKQVTAQKSRIQSSFTKSFIKSAFFVALLIGGWMIVQKTDLIYDHHKKIEGRISTSGDVSDSQVTVEVPANQSWTYVCQLRAGQHYEIDASGTWDCSGGFVPQPDLVCGPDGLQAPNWVKDGLLTYYPGHTGRLIHNLIARVGDDVISVGTRYSGVASKDCIVYVGPNDYDVGDNSGSLTVTLLKI